jgi:uncharacterized membrane protein YhhN
MVAAITGACGSEMKRSSFFLWLFAAASFAELGSILAGWQAAQLISKPAIMLSLIGYYLSSDAKRNMTFVRALFFCWTGDVLLMFQPKADVFFMAGLGAFLIGQLLYIVSYKQMRDAEPGTELSGPQKVRFSIPVVLAGTGLFVILYPGLGGLKLPVLFYAIALMTMVMTAIFRYGKTSSQSYWLILSGAILFFVSDSILAMNKFYSPVPLGNLWIMSTYIAAQFLIVKGAIAHFGK